MRILRFLTLSIFVFLLIGAGSARAQQGVHCVISARGIGPIQLGMTLRQARQAFPQAVFTRATDGDGVALVGVQFARDDLMVIYAGEEDPEAIIDWSKTIEFIESFHSGCTMANGVGPGMLITDAEKRLGKIQEISQSEIESREYVSFANQPKGYWFRLDYTGIFPQGSRTTRSFQPGSKILSIAVVLEKQ